MELKSGFDFLNSCGNINAGFEGCSFKFSEEVLKFYDAKVTTADDGFSIELKAKKDIQKDECVQFSINSLGKFKALDKMNRATDKCTPKDFVKKNLSTIYRATDYIEGQAAHLQDTCRGQDRTELIKAKGYYFDKLGNYL